MAVVIGADTRTGVADARNQGFLGRATNMAPTTRTTPAATRIRPATGSVLDAAQVRSLRPDARHRHRDQHRQRLLIPPASSAQP